MREIKHCRSDYAPSVSSETNGDQSDVLFHHGLIYHKTGDLVNASLCYQQVLHIDGKHAGAWHFLGVVALLQNDHHKANEYIEQALDLCDNNPVYFNNYGVVLKSLERFQEAKEAFEKAITLNSRYADAWSNFGQMLLLLKEEEQSIEHAINKALELVPNHPDALLHLAELRHRQECHVECAELLIKILPRQPNNVELLCRIAECYILSKRFEQAIEFLLRVEQIAPNQEGVQHRLGICYGEMDDLLKAKTHFRKAAAFPKGKTSWRWKHLGYCPVYFDDAQQIDDYWLQLNADLDEAIEANNIYDWRTLAYDGFTPSFHLPHHNKCCREIKEKFTQLFAPSFAQFQKPELKYPQRRSGKIRIGFLVTPGHEGVFWRYTSEIIKRLDPKRFEAFLIYHETSAEAFRDTIDLSHVTHFTFEFFIYVDSPDANGIKNGKYDLGETVVDSLTLSVYIGYAGIKSVDFVDGNNLKSNWVETTNDQGEAIWVFIDDYTYLGNDLIEWEKYRIGYVNNQTVAVFSNASYIQGHKFKIEPTFKIYTGGRECNISVRSNNLMTNGSYSNGILLSGTYTGIGQGMAKGPKAESNISLSMGIAKYLFDLNWTFTATKTINSVVYSKSTQDVSGGHGIYTTIAEPVESYTTDDGANQNNTATEFRLYWAYESMIGATTATGGTVVNTTENPSPAPQGAAEKITAKIGHGGASSMSTDWNAWRYLQNQRIIGENRPSIGDCGTMASLAVAGLGQVGVTAIHDRAFAPDPTKSINSTSCMSMVTDTFTNNGQTINAKMIFAGNNFEAFFSVIDAGVTKAYTVYPPNGPITIDRNDVIKNLHYKVLYSVTRYVFWGFLGNYRFNNIDYYDMDPVSTLWTTGWPGYNLPSPITGI